MTGIKSYGPDKDYPYLVIFNWERFKDYTDYEHAKAAAIRALKEKGDVCVSIWKSVEDLETTEEPE